MAEGGIAPVACAEVRDDLELLALDALEPERAAVLRAHVGQCASCATALAEAEQLVGTVLLASAPVVPSSVLIDRIVAARVGEQRPSRDAEEDAPRLRPARGRRAPGRGRATLMVAAAAAAALVIGITAGVLIGQSRATVTSRDAQAAGEVRTGVLTGWPGGGGGAVLVTSGDRPTLVVSLDGVRPGSSYGCQVRLADGTLVEVGSWTPSTAEEATWAVPLAATTAEATEVVITGSGGAPLSSAMLS